MVANVFNRLPTEIKSVSNDLQNFKFRLTIFLMQHFFTRIMNFLELSIARKKIHGLSPQANYTDRATAACQRSVNYSQDVSCSSSFHLTKWFTGLFSFYACCTLLKFLITKLHPIRHVP
jgi:hypothetical protein